MYIVLWYNVIMNWINIVLILVALKIYDIKPAFGEHGEVIGFSIIGIIISVSIILNLWDYIFTDRTNKS